MAFLGTELINVSYFYFKGSLILQVRGIRSHTRISSRLTSQQNSGVSLVTSFTQYASSKDKSHVLAGNNYYGRIEVIWELDYCTFHICLLSCIPLLCDLSLHICLTSLHLRRYYQMGIPFLYDLTLRICNQCVDFQVCISCWSRFRNVSVILGLFRSFPVQFVVFESLTPNSLCTS